MHEEIKWNERLAYLFRHSLNEKGYKMADYSRSNGCGLLITAKSEATLDKLIKEHQKLCESCQSAPYGFFKTLDGGYVWI